MPWTKVCPWCGQVEFLFVPCPCPAGQKDKEVWDKRLGRKRPPTRGLNIIERGIMAKKTVKAVAVEAVAEAVVEAIAPTPAEPTPAELRAQIDAALNSGDYIQAGKLTAILGKGQIAAVKAAEEERQKVLATLTEKVKVALRTEVELLLEAGELDGCDGVWFSIDFADMVNGVYSASCRLVKTIKGTATVKRTGGGTPKRYNISNEDMLTKHGTTPATTKRFKDLSLTLQQAWEQRGSAADQKNWTGDIRKELLKLEGLL